MRQAVVLGTGGHCRVILSMLVAGRRHDILEIIELGSPLPSERIMGALVTSNPDNLPALCVRDDIDIFLAIGKNELRKYWWEKVKALGLPMPNLVSPHALVDGSAILGEANVICARSFIGPQAELGDNNLINTAAIVEHEVSIGSHCHLAPSSTIAGRSRLDSSCFLGAGATIVDSITIASNTVIGAGATLIGSVEQPGGVYIGVPAKRRETRQ
jgi:sugar O-acyltransferase (sialic acid O-acetyltransferase NeuD family)